LKTISKSNVNPGKIGVVTTSPVVNNLVGLNLPSSFKMYLKKVSSLILTIQYSLTPAS